MEDLHLKIKLLEQDKKLMPYKKKVIDMQIKLLQMALDKRRESVEVKQSMNSMVRELFF